MSWFSILTMLRGSAIFFKNLRMLRTGARFSSKLRGCSAWERDFLRIFENAPHASVIFVKIGRMLRMGAGFFSKIKDAPDRSAILFPLGRRQIDKISRMSRAGGRLLKRKISKFAECSARERNFDPIRTKINRRNLEDASTNSAIFQDQTTKERELIRNLEIFGRAAPPSGPVCPPRLSLLDYLHGGSGERINLYR